MPPQPQPPPSILAATVPAWQAASIVVGMMVSGMGLAWTGASQIARIEARVEAVAAQAAADVRATASTLTEARAAGIRERELLRERSDMADREHATQISALQAQAAATSTYQASAGAQMQAILASIAAMQDDLKTLLRQRRVDAPGIEGRAAQAVARRDGGTVLRAGRGVPVTITTGG